MAVLVSDVDFGRVSSVHDGERIKHIHKWGAAMGVLSHVQLDMGISWPYRYGNFTTYSGQQERNDRNDHPSSNL